MEFVGAHGVWDDVAGWWTVEIPLPPVVGNGMVVRTGIQKKEGWAAGERAPNLERPAPPPILPPMYDNLRHHHSVNRQIDGIPLLLAGWLRLTMDMLPEGAEHADTAPRLGRGRDRSGTSVAK